MIRDSPQSGPFSKEDPAQLSCDNYHDIRILQELPIYKSGRNTEIQKLHDTLLESIHCCTVLECPRHYAINSSQTMLQNVRLIAGLDADILIKVTSIPASDAACDGGVKASASARLLNPDTRRPVYGYIVWCQIPLDDFEGELSTATHEVLHILVRDRSR